MPDFSYIFAGAAVADYFSPGNVTAMITGGLVYLMAASAFFPGLAKLTLTHSGFVLGYGLSRLVGMDPQTSVVVGIGFAYFGFFFDVSYHYLHRVRPYRLGADGRILQVPGRYTRVKRHDPTDLDKAP